MHDWITPDWPAPGGVHALSTTRLGGVSEGPYQSLTLGDHVGDRTEHVATNRARVASCLPAPPLWLAQVHGTCVVDAARAVDGAQADASIVRTRDRVCAVMTADCLPVLFCDQRGQVVAAAHAGWRGLAGGVLEATLAAMAVPAPDVMAWLGPAIGPAAFEVGDEVRAAFVAADPAAAAAFVPHAAGKWLADLYSLARLRLHAHGVTAIYGGDRCTVSEPGAFFSHRRDRVTGRMASLIWLA